MRLERLQVTCFKTGMTTGNETSLQLWEVCALFAVLLNQLFIHTLQKCSLYKNGIQPPKTTVDQLYLLKNSAFSRKEKMSILKHLNIVC